MVYSRNDPQGCGRDGSQDSKDKYSIFQEGATGSEVETGKRRAAEDFG